MTPTQNDASCQRISTRGPTASAVPVADSGRKGANQDPIPSDQAAANDRKMLHLSEPSRGGGGAGPALGHILIRIFQSLVVLGVFVALLVLSDVAVARLFPSASTALHHGVLSAQAAVLALIACGLVYLTMDRQHKRLSNTAQRLQQLVDDYRRNPDKAGRFENPHLVTCGEVLDHRPPDCPAPDRLGRRCWQTAALRSGGRTTNGSSNPMDVCYGCEVYQQSCPDKLTRLGESFNNLMFLLEEEAHHNSRMHAQMVEKEKMVSIGQIAAGVAHEVCNPLSSISSVAQTLKRKTKNESTVEQLDIIETHIKRISHTVRQLVRMAPPGPERWEQCDVVEILRDAMRLIRFDRRARNTKIDFEPPKNIPRTFALANQLQQVFLNLGLNALDAMPEGGTLTVRVRSRRRDIVVSIKDTGTGIPTELGERIFEPFFTTKEAGKGTGLGLAVSFGIVQKHGGSISFDSRPGSYTVFSVTMPTITEPPSGTHGTHDDTTGR